MLTIRAANERGRMSAGWLDARYSFSFAGYHDPDHMGWGSLRVLNDDVIAASGGFPMHGHANFEIVTYMLKGKLAHEDNVGHKSVIRAGDIQHMSAGSGVRHSEFNPSDTEKTHLLQIWFQADKKNIAPAYHHQHVEPDEKKNQLKLILSQTGRAGSAVINQDIDFYASHLDGRGAIEFSPEPGRRQWVQVARGSLHVNGISLGAGDGAALGEEALIRFDKANEAEFLLFDMKNPA